MKNYTTEELQLLVTIAEEPSFSAAASRAELSNSALSKRLDRLEEKIGRTLFHRPTKPVKLTAAGEIFHRMAKSVLHSIEEAEREIKELEYGKPVRIVANTSIGVIDLVDVITSFKEKHQAKVEFRSASVPEVIRAVKTDQADIGLLPSHPNVEGLRFFEYRHDRLVLLTPLSHPFATRDRIAFAELANTRLVGTTEARRLTHVLATQAKIAGIALTYEIITDSFEMQADIIGTGNYCAVMLESVARHYQRTRLCKTIPLSDDWAKNAIFYICVQDRGALSQPALDFWQMLAGKYK